MLAISTEHIAFGDPLQELKTFERAVSTGRYPVELSVRDESEPAAARIRLAEVPAIRWEPALRRGEDLDDLRPGEWFGAYVGNRSLAVFADEASSRALATPDLDAMRPADWNGECDARCFVLPGASIAIFTTNGPGSYAAYWGFTPENTLSELVVDLNGFLENDYTELKLDLSNAGPGLVRLDTDRAVPNVRIAERTGQRVVVEVERRRTSSLELRDFARRSAESTGIVRYEFDPHVQQVRAVAHFGLRRLDRRA